MFDSYDLSSSDFLLPHASSARQVLLAIEGIATDYGAVSIALHVFAHNEVAQRLYRDAGYGISGYAMRKRLDDAAA